MPTRLLIALSVVLAAAIAGAEDWPQWRGPHRDDVSRETGLLKEWPEAGPQQKWLFRECGVGYGGPAIVDGSLYILGARDGVEQLIVVSTADGSEQWRVDLGEEWENRWGNGPRGTPTVDEGFVYTLAARGNLNCIDVASQTIVWTQAMQDLGGEIPKWGYSESPLVHQGRVICTPGGEDGAIAAFDRKTGELLWQTEELTAVAHYSSPSVVERNGRQEVVQLLVNKLVGVDFETGAVNWEVPWPGRVAVIPSPILRDDYVYVTSGYGVGSMLVRVGPDNEVETIYENRVMKNHHGGAILIGDHVYGHSNDVGWVCQGFLSGDRIWREREALGKGAISYADGRFYCLAEDTGEVVLIEPSTEGWQEHGRFTLAPQTEQRKEAGKIWTHPVIANGRLYLRDQELLFAFDIEGDRRTAAK